MRPSSEDSERSARKEQREYMLWVFRLGIPEIRRDAEVVFVGGPIGEIPREVKEKLQKYDIPGPWGSRFMFTAFYNVLANQIYVKRIGREELPDWSPWGEFYIIQYIEREAPSDP